MGAAFSAALNGLTNPGAVSAGEIVALRRAAYADGRIDAVEARALLTLHKAGAGGEAGSDWADFFVEALADHFVLQRETPDWGASYKPDFGRAFENVARVLSPMPGHKTNTSPNAWSDVAPAAVGAEEAGVLIAAFQAEGGFVLDQTERRVLVRIFERCVEIPANLKEFALKALHDTVLADGRIAADEVELLRRVLYGPGGDEGIAVSRPEAEMLFALKNAARGGDNAPEWTDFFARALGCHVLFGGGSPEMVDGAEASWLSARIGVGRASDADMRALLQFLKREAKGMAPRIAELALQAGA